MMEIRLSSAGSWRQSPYSEVKWESFLALGRFELVAHFHNICHQVRKQHRLKLG